MALVVGGSGMLGSAIMQALKCPGTHFKNPAPKTVPFDIEAVKNFKCIINCVADKNVDRCERSFAKSKQINSDFVKSLVDAMAPDSRLIQISSDYAIDPTNVYGATKMLGEFHAMKAPAWTVLRVPALYLDATDVLKTDFTVNELDMDDVPRYHTSCLDVAKVVKKIYNEKLMGILHFSSPMARSKCHLAKTMNIPVNVRPADRDPTRPGHLYIGNDFDIVPRTLDISKYTIPVDPSKIFMVLDLDGTLLDTVDIHQKCYRLANMDRVKKTQLLKMHREFDFKWNSDVLIDFIHRHKISHVVLTNTTMDVVDHFRKCVPKLNLLKNFVTKDQYENRKPDYEPYRIAMQHWSNQPHVMVFDDIVDNLVPMAGMTRLLFHMADRPVDTGVFTLNDFSRLVFAMGG